LVYLFVGFYAKCTENGEKSTQKYLVQEKFFL